MTAPEMVLPMLLTGANGLARWENHAIRLQAGAPQVWLSALSAASQVQWRESPPGFASGFHCTTQPQWLVVLQGVMEIGLRDGSWRRFGPGECFYSGDTLPPGVAFDETLHGHRSRQSGDAPLRTLFVRAALA